jgi:hypothetical protein
MYRSYAALFIFSTSFTVRLRTRLQRYWRYAPSRKTQGFADDPTK